MHMNISTDSVEQFLARQPQVDPQRTYKPSRGLTKERLDEFERQSPDSRKDTHSFQIMQYLRDVDPSEPIVTGQNSSMTVSNKEASMKAYIKEWEIQFEELTVKKIGWYENGKL